MLHKNLPNSVKDVDARRGVICAYGSSFNVVDDGNDMCVPGCYTKTIAQQGPGSKQPRIKFLYQHDTTQILGVPSVLKEDGFGLYFEAKIADTALGRDVLTLYSEGILTEHSIGYETVVAEWDRTHQVRLLKELRLFEISSVTFGMNPETPVVAVKSVTDPSHLASIATKAARLDSLLHNGTLRSDALCETLERELKALQTALAPTADAASQPYTIQGVLAAMDDLTARLGSKAASGKATWPLGDRDAAWDGAGAHNRIVKWATKDDGTLDSGKMQSVHFWYDSSASDAIGSYKLLFCDIVGGDVKAMPKGIFACAGSHGVEAADIPSGDVAGVKAKIEAYYKRMAKAFDDDSIVAPWSDDSSGNNKGATTVTRRMVKGSGGNVAVSEDGTHAAYTGTHVHGHKAFDSQGGDDTHEHKHSHEDDAKHDHSHDAKTATSVQRSMRKAVDFATALQQVSADDTLQDEWGDAFQALVNALSSVMVNACYGMGAVADSSFNPQDAAETILSQFSDAMADLVKRSLAADFCPMLDDDGDSFYDPDGPNASDDDDYKGRRAPLAMPDAPALIRKAGRAISGANRETITTALDGMTKAMGDMQMHHAAIADLMTKTDPDAVRQDEADTQGDDDSENGGHNINKSRHSDTPRRTATAERTSQASTTHDGDSDTSDTTALLADLDSVVSRLKSTAAAGKASN